jgi:tRNA U34 5-methylaminomethyl-2-thiouridine-forming methyltransferase MnmC
MTERLIKTADGSHTIFVPELNEHYHSVNGAVNESLTVYIGNGYDFCPANPVNILEIGFGTGLNALLTFMRSVADKRTVSYTTVEKYPLGEETVSLLNHSSFAGTEGKKYSELIHSAEWNRPVCLSDHFTLTKLELDFTVAELSGKYDLIYFDAFGPDKQPGMWSELLFRKIAGVTVPRGILVTYSSKGTVKRALQACGFEITLLPGPRGKREVLRAVKK